MAEDVAQYFGARTVFHLPTGMRVTQHMATQVGRRDTRGSGMRDQDVAHSGGSR